MWGQIINFLSFLAFVWLSIQLVRSVFFWLFLWQRKEYRWDRIKAHFSLPFGRSQLVAAFSPLSLIFWRKPKITLRILLLLLGFLIFGGRIYFFILRVVAEVIREWPLALFPAFSLALLILFFLTPFLMGLLNGLLGLMLEPFYSLALLLTKKKLEKLKPLVIGITGSFGKTATKQIIKQVLAVEFKVLATEQSINTPLGIAKTVLFNLKPDHQLLIVEMGAYKTGEIKQLVESVRPKIGLLTGINLQHQQLFGNQKKIIEEKYQLIKSLPKDGLALFNGENSICNHLAKKTKKVKVKIYHFPPKDYPTPLLGRFQQLNIQAALEVADYLGIKRSQALKAVKKLKPSSLTLQLRKGWRNCRVLDNSYNSNPDGFEQALEELGQLSAKKKIVVTAGIIELGSQAGKIHQRLGGKISQTADQLILLNNNFFSSIKKGAHKKFVDKIKVIDDKVELKKYFEKIINRKTVVLLEGWNWEAKKILLEKR